MPGRDASDRGAFGLDASANPGAVPYTECAARAGTPHRARAAQHYTQSPAPGGLRGFSVPARHEVFALQLDRSHGSHPMLIITVCPSADV